jgi:hypothetical protein
MAYLAGCITIFLFFGFFVFLNGIPSIHTSASLAFGPQGPSTPTTLVDISDATRWETPELLSSAAPNTFGFVGQIGAQGKFTGLRVVGLTQEASASQPGATGPEGPQGPIGEAGLDGEQGEAGPAGARGSRSDPGATGLSGLDGLPGLDGLSGLDGASGLQGISGLDGVSGSGGPQGAAGSQGVQGLIGLTGITGPQGPIGLKGATGSPGLQGIAGVAGSIGPTGAAGGRGAIGPAGPAGGSGSQGAAGPLGPTGPQGAAGSSVVGPTGPAGPAAGRCSFSSKLQDSSQGIAQLTGVYIRNGNLVFFEVSGTFSAASTFDRGPYKFELPFRTTAEYVFRNAFLKDDAKPPVRYPVSIYADANATQATLYFYRAPSDILVTANEPFNLSIESSFHISGTYETDKGTTCLN